MMFEIVIPEAMHLTPLQLLGIPIALVGAVVMSLGAQFQHRGVNKVGQLNHDSGKGGLSWNSLKKLFARPSWVVGTLLLGLAVVLQLTSLVLSPLILVQPLGSIALVVTAIMNAKISKIQLNRASIVAIILCVGGVATFVSVAAFTAQDSIVTDERLVVMLWVLGGAVIIVGTYYLVLRNRLGAVGYIIAAGILYGIVATLSKVVLLRVLAWDFGILTLVALVSLLLAAALGAYFLQTAYTSGPPDLAIAGLTVVDPMVAIMITVLVLGEADNAPLIAVLIFILAGIVSVIGVFLLAKHHPQTGALAHSKSGSDLPTLIPEEIHHLREQRNNPS